jgi:hypothetical protein
MATYTGIGYDSTNGKNRTGTSSDTVSFNTGVNIDGNLEVVGTIISRDEERVLVQDNFLDLNFGYTTDAAMEAGLAANYDPTTTGRTINSTSANITFAAASGATRPKLSVALAQLPNSTFADGDIIQIAGTTNAENDGFYVVHSQTSGADPAILEIKSTEISGSADTINAKFAQVNFTGEVESTSTSVTVFKINIAALQVSTAGAWQVANGAVDSSFATFTPLGTSSLQVAYDTGNSITTDASGAIAFTFDTNARGFTMDGDAAGVGDVTMGATNTINTFTVDAAGAISLDAAAASNVSTSVGELTLAASQAAGGITLNAGTGGVDIDITAAGSGSGDGALTINAAGASTIDVAGAGLTLTTTTSGNIAVTSAGTLAVTGAGQSDFGDDTGVLRFDGSGNLSDNALVSMNVSTSGLIAFTSGGGTACTIGDGTGAIQLDGSGDLLESGLVNTNLTGSGTMTLTGGGLSKFGDDTGTLDFDGSGALSETGITTIALTPSSTFDLDAAGGITIDGTSVLIGDDGDTAGVSLLSTGGNMALQTATSGNISITSVGTFASTSTTYDIDASGAFTLDAATVTIGGDTDTGDIVITSASGDVEVASENGAKEVRIVSNYPKLVRGINAGAAGVTAGDCLYGDIVGGALRVSSTDADAAATSQFIGIAANTAAAGNQCNVVVAGIVKEVTGDGAFVAANNLGKKVYLSTATGKISLSPPTGAGDVVFQVGLCVGGTGTAWEVLIQPQFIMEIG